MTTLYPKKVLEGKITKRPMRYILLPMNLLQPILKTIIDCIFPVSRADMEILSYSPEKALEILPRAPETPIKDTYSVFAYKNKLVSSLIWNIKYKKSWKATRIGGYALYNKILDIVREKRLGRIIIVPIPITRKRRNERGFNQCELLLDEIKKSDTNNLFLVKRDLLKRIVHKNRQTLKNRKDRLSGSKGVFSVCMKNLEKLKISNNLHDFDYGSTTIIVIDDVITTGSTIKEAMETIRQSGFKNTYGLSLAH